MWSSYLRCNRKQARTAGFLALFSSWDPDGSGTLTLKELEKVLRRPMELDAKLKAGGAGAIELTAKNKNALR